MRYSIIIIMLTISTSALFPQSNNKIPDSLVIKTLLTTILDKDFTADREVKVDYLELPPNTVLERHWHPGEEFHYYLEGEVEIKIEGESSIKGVPGMWDMSHIKSRTWQLPVKTVRASWYSVYIQKENHGGLLIHQGQKYLRINLTDAFSIRTSLRTQSSE